jgi:hypothetical protein
MVMDVQPGTRRRLLVISGVWPHVTASSEAANVVAYSILYELAASGSFAVSFAYVNTSVTSVPEPARPEIEALKALGVQFLEPTCVPVRPPLTRRPLAFVKAITTDPALFFTRFGAGDELKRTIGDRAFDAALTIWTEVGTYAASELGIPCFAYYGNPDHKVFEAQDEILRISGAHAKGVSGVLGRMRSVLLRHIIERAHLAVLRRFRFIADVAANDAAYYKSEGVNAFYLQNTWPHVQALDWEARRDALEQENPNKIIGSVGNLSATGNTLGLFALHSEVLPALRRKVRAPIEIHICGGGKPRPVLEPLLADPWIRMRGFVKDLDTEILSAPVFLITNNHHRFKVGHTRFLHAWSLGACVVAFSDSRKAMPEIEHGRNALLGRTTDEIADCVVSALADKTLRRRLGRGGMHTLRSSFDPVAVCSRLTRHIEAALPGHDE